ncbi:unnamed protein product [Rotaria sordida]|uniref:Uncharacterized protein n=1 Tax=Rotaria sordida TaxID=392033 RepID=A0A814F7L2_9BILA|nr:unnamed protein product [Rotaria sordida]CAF1378172.1 unnamed protein product [Rotaria sordida]
MASSFDYDSYIKRCVFAWVSIGLIWKNITLFLILILFRIKSKQVILVGDEKVFQQQTDGMNQTMSNNTQQLNRTFKHKISSIKRRIKKALEYETHFMVHFLLLFFVFTEVLQSTTTRLIVYGSIFVIARYIHNGGILFRKSYARMIGITFSILVIGAITLDLAIILTNEVAQKNTLNSISSL